MPVTWIRQLIVQSSIDLDEVKVIVPLPVKAPDVTEPVTARLPLPSMMLGMLPAESRSNGQTPTAPRGRAARRPRVSPAPEFAEVADAAALVAEAAADVALLCAAAAKIPRGADHDPVPEAPDLT